jgi:integration host factor subunit alpha
MSLTKKNIIKNVNKNSLISIEDGAILLESFLLFIKENARSNKVKLSGFGTFSFKKTPKRTGRNPKTSDSYIIPELNKLNFMPSNVLKEKIN